MTSTKYVQVPVELVKRLVGWTDIVTRWQISEPTSDKFAAMRDELRALIAAATQQAQGGEVKEQPQPQAVDVSLINEGDMPQAVDEREELAATVKEAFRELSHIENHLELTKAPHDVRNRTIALRCCIRELNIAAARASLSAQPTPVAAEQHTVTDKDGFTHYDYLAGPDRKGGIAVRVHGHDYLTVLYGAKVAAHPVAGQSRDEQCDMCNGRGEIGGFVSADSGYQTDPCPACANAEQQADAGGEPDYCLLIDELIMSWQAKGNEKDQCERRIAARAALEAAIARPPVPAQQGLSEEQVAEAKRVLLLRYKKRAYSDSQFSEVLDIFASIVTARAIESGLQSAQEGKQNG